MLNSHLKTKCAEKNRTWGNTFVIMVDIDNFKSINDKYWHPKWDEVLKNIANIFKETFRQEDVVWRWWGEEFLVILSWMDVSDVEKKIENLRKNIESSLHMKSGLDNSITISSWISNLCKWDINWNAATKLADNALYKAKHEWKNKVVINLREEK